VHVTTPPSRATDLSSPRLARLEFLSCFVYYFYVVCLLIVSLLQRWSLWPATHVQLERTRHTGPERQLAARILVARV